MTLSWQSRRTASALARHEELVKGEKRGFLPEICDTVVISVALDEEFDLRCSVLDSHGRGWGSEIDHIPCRLILSLFAFFTNIPENSLTASSFQFQRELQGSLCSKALSVH